MVCFDFLNCWRWVAKDAAKDAVEPFMPESKPVAVDGQISPATRTPQSPRSAATSPSTSPTRSHREEPAVELFDLPMVPVAAFLTLADVVHAVYASAAAHRALTVGDKLLLPWLIYSKESTCCPEAVINHVSLPHCLALRFVGSRLALDSLKQLHKKTPGRCGFKQLTRFVAKGCHVHAHDMAFLHGVVDQGQVSLLNLEKNMLTDAVVEELVNTVLVKDKHIETLCLRWNKIGNRGAAALASLVNHPTLTCLNLKTNCVGPAGADALARMVAQDTGIEVLNLRAQVPRLPDSVALSFAAALRTNGRLRRLKLRRNKITCVGAEALCEALHSGPASRSMEELDLQENYLKTRGGMACAALLDVNRRIEVVYAGGNTFGRGELLMELGALDLDRRLELEKQADV